MHGKIVPSANTSTEVDTRWGPCSMQEIARDSAKGVALCLTLRTAANRRLSLLQSVPLPSGRVGRGSGRRGQRG